MISPSCSIYPSPKHFVLLRLSTSMIRTRMPITRHHSQPEIPDMNWFGKQTRVPTSSSPKSSTCTNHCVTKPRHAASVELDSASLSSRLTKPSERKPPVPSVRIASRSPFGLFDGHDGPRFHLMHASCPHGYPLGIGRGPMAVGIVRLAPTRLF